VNAIWTRYLYATHMRCELIDRQGRTLRCEGVDRIREDGNRSVRPTRRYANSLESLAAVKAPVRVCFGMVRFLPTVPLDSFLCIFIERFTTLFFICYILATTVLVSGLSFYCSNPFLDLLSLRPRSVSPGCPLTVPLTRSFFRTYTIETLAKRNQLF